MNRMEIQDIRSAALRDAERRLLGIAADFESMAGHVELPSKSHYSYDAKVAERRTLLEKSALLVGQAKLVRKL